MRIDKFRYKSMDMRIPFEILAKGVEGGNHTEMFAITVVFQDIVCSRDMLFPEFSNDGFVGQGANGIPGRNKENI